MRFRIEKKKTKKRTNHKKMTHYTKNINPQHKHYDVQITCYWKEKNKLSLPAMTCFQITHRIFRKFTVIKYTIVLSYTRKKTCMSNKIKWKLLERGKRFYFMKNMNIETCLINYLLWLVATIIRETKMSKT